MHQQNPFCSHYWWSENYLEYTLALYHSAAPIPPENFLLVLYDRPFGTRYAETRSVETIAFSGNQLENFLFSAEAAQK